MSAVVAAAYLIFVISFTQAGFFNPKFLHPKTMQNTRKLQQIPPKSVKYAVLCVQSGKFYTGQIFFTRAPPVVPATNMRYVLLCPSSSSVPVLDTVCPLKPKYDQVFQHNMCASRGWS